MVRVHSGARKEKYGYYNFTYFNFTYCFNFTQTMIWVLLTSILWSSVSGLSEYHRMKDRQLNQEGNNDYKYHSETWHKLEFLDAGLAIGTGISIGFDIKENDILTGIADILMVSAIRWNVRDGVYNLEQGNSFYYQSPTTMSSIEQFGTPLVKISFLICALIFRMLI